MRNKTPIVVVVGCVLLIGAVVWGWSHWSTRSALDALNAENPTDAEIEVIAGLLADRSGKYRARAEQKLREVGSRAVPALTNLSKNGDDEVRLSAAKLAADIDPEGQGFAGLENVLHDESVELRRGTTNVLYTFIKAGEKTKQSRSAALLLTSVGDPDPTVRERVADGLGHMHSKEAKQALQRLAQDEDRDVAYAANRRLERAHR